MRICNQSISTKLKDVPILLVTAGTRDAIWNQHYEWRHPPDTVMIYTQACQALSEQVHIITLEQLLERNSAAKFLGKKGLVVDIVGGLFDLELIGLPSTLANSLNMACFPASNKNYVTTHDKLLGKHIAHNCGLRVARTLSGPDLEEFGGAIIQKPICGGDSVGIEFKDVWPKYERPPVGTFVEEFVLGSDSTIHFMRNKDGQSYSILEHLITNAAGSSWFDMKAKEDANRLYGQKTNSSARSKYEGELSESFIASIKKLLEFAGYPFLGRIDFRQTKLEGNITTDDMTFLELNVAPTISNANNWYDGIKKKYGRTPLFATIDEQAIHPAAKSLAIMLHEFYDQSLSMQGKRPVRAENLPN